MYPSLEPSPFASTDGTLDVEIKLIFVTSTASFAILAVVTASEAISDASNQNITLLNEVSVPADTTLEVFAGQKIVMETTDVLTIGASAGSALDVALSVMEIT